MSRRAALLLVEDEDSSKLEAQARASGAASISTVRCDRSEIADALAVVAGSVSARPFELLWVTTWDLPIGPRQLLRVTAELVRAGVALCSLSEPFLHETPGEVFVWLNDLFDRRRRGAIKGGMRAGRPPGRPRKPIPERVLTMAAQGKSLSVISRTVGVPRSTLQRFIAQHRKSTEQA